MVVASKRFNDCIWLRRICAILVIILIGLSNAIDMVNLFSNLFKFYCVEKSFNTEIGFFLLQFASSRSTANEVRLVYNTSIINNTSANLVNKIGNQTIQLYAFNSSIALPSSTCVFPSYFNYFAILILIAIAIITQLSHLTRIFLMVLFSGKTLMFYYLMFTYLTDLLFNSDLLYNQCAFPRGSIQV